MRRPLRLLSVLLAVGAVTTFVLGAAGFTAVEANRTVDVAVVSDDEAYIGIPDSIGLGSERVATNRFPTDVDITAKIAVPDVDNNRDTDIVVDGTELAPGSSTQIEGLHVGPGESVKVEFDEITVDNETQPLPEHISIELSDVQGDNIEASVGERTVDVEQ